MPADPRSARGSAQKQELLDKASKRFNDLFRGNKGPVIPPNHGEDLKPNEGEEIR